MAKRDTEFPVEERQRMPESVLRDILRAYVYENGKLRKSRGDLIDFWQGQTHTRSTAGTRRLLQYYASGTRTFTPRAQRILMRFLSGEPLRAQQEALRSHGEATGETMIPVYDPSSNKITYRYIDFYADDITDGDFDFYDAYMDYADDAKTLLQAEEIRNEEFMEWYGAPLLPLASDGDAAGILDIPDWTAQDRDDIVARWSTIDGPVAPPWPLDTDTIPQLQERIQKVSKALRPPELVPTAQQLLDALGLTPEQRKALKKLL